MESALACSDYRSPQSEICAALQNNYAPAVNNRFTLKVNNKNRKKIFCNLCLHKMSKLVSELKKVVTQALNCIFAQFGSVMLKRQLDVAMLSCFFKTSILKNIINSVMLTLELMPLTVICKDCGCMLRDISRICD